MPALSKLCAKGIAKAGKSVFKFQGKDYDVKLDKPLTTKKDRDPSGKPSKAPSNTAKCSKRGKKRADRPKRTKPVTRTTWDDATETYKDKTCIYAKHSQACLHYSSVISRRPALSSMTCTSRAGAGGNIREMKNSYYVRHHTDWINGWMRKAGQDCERDEFPPAAIWQGRDKDVWIRLSPWEGNNQAGKLFNGCPENIKTEKVGRATSDHIEPGCDVVSYCNQNTQCVYILTPHPGL